MSAGHELALALFTAGESLRTFPNRGRHGRVAGTRELVVVHPYVISYEVTPDAVLILNIIHGGLLA